MNDYLKCYKVKIHALSPIYIGSGSEIGKKEYIYMPWNHKVIIPDIYKMYQDLQKKGLGREFENYMMDSRAKIPSLGQWLGQHKFKEQDYNRWKKYEMDAGEAFAQDKESRPTAISAFVKDAYGLPYVPGSSIKGMIRTALIAWEIQKHPEKYRSIKETIRRRSTEKQKRTVYLNRETKQLENEVLYTLKRDEKTAGNAVNDNLSGLHVGDSNPISLKQLTLSQKIDYNLQHNEKPFNVLRETLIPETDIFFQISIDTSICPYDMEDIIEALNCFGKISYEYFYSRFKRGSKKENIVWLGGGCGFLSKTVVYPLFEKDAVKVVDNIYKNTLPDKIYKQHKHEKYVGLNLAPHICKCTRYQGELYDMGMGQIEYEKL